MDILAIGVAGSGGGGGGSTDAYTKAEMDYMLKSKMGYAEAEDNKVVFYNASSKDKKIVEIEIPSSKAIDTLKTEFIPDFKFDSVTYPDTTDPNLDGKPVLVLAIMVSETEDEFSFLNMETLVDIYTGGNTSSVVITVENGVITGTINISQEDGNKVELKDDGLFVGSDSEPVSGSENLITSDGVYKLSEELKKTATANTTDTAGTNGMMSAYDKTKLDNMGTFKDDESMKLAIDGMFSGYDMSGLDPDDDDGIADHSDIADIFDNPEPTPPSSREPEVQGSFMSLSADEIDDILGGTTPTPDDGSDDGDDEDLDSGDIDDILGI